MNVCTKCGVQFEDGAVLSKLRTKRGRSVVKKNMSGGVKLALHC